MKHPYVCCAKPLLVEGGRYLREGESVPGAENWVRVETWVRARRIRRR